jgi:hypothetical protein
MTFYQFIMFCIKNITKLYGGNLMRLLPAIILLFLLMTDAVHAGLPDDLKAKVGGIEGQFVVDSEPLSYAIVSFFSVKNGSVPLKGKVQRVPDMVARTDGEGRFSARLLAGTYYLGALVRKRGVGPGPPQQGEPRYFAMDEKGKLRLFQINARQTNDVGIITGAKREAPEGLTDFITVEGVISDENGKALAGAVVVVKTSLEQTRPSFVSRATESDGRYRLKLPPGSYYLMARESFAGVSRPGPGSYVGLYGRKMPIGAEAPFNSAELPGAFPRSSGILNWGSEAKKIEGNHGDLFSGIDIQLFRIPDPVETRKKFEGEARARDRGEGRQGDDKRQSVDQGKK